VLLVALLVVPAVGALVLALLPARLDRAGGLVGVATSALTFALSLALLAGWDLGPARTDVPAVAVSPRHELDVAWIPAIDARFHLGVDGVSLPLVLLTTLLTLCCAVYTLRRGWGSSEGRASGTAGEGRTSLFLALVLVLEVGALGTFLALDLLLFFVFFETVLAPMYFLIAGWGGAGARHAATKFVLYTLLGSVLLLVGLLTVYAGSGTLDIVELSQRGGTDLARGTQVLAFLALFLGFAVKSPLWPLHTWLPDAHTAAPTVGSVLLAGVLLKMGTYGLVRVAVPILPEGAQELAPVLAVLAVAGIVVGSLCCLAQNELKRLIAYSSVGHMGFVLLGIATLTPTGVNAALLANVAHGVITGLLFFVVGSVKDRLGTLDLDALGGGLTAKAPALGGLLTLGAVASLGLPGLAGFWGEALALLATLRPQASLPRSLYLVLLAVAALGTAVTAAYFLRMLRRVAVGPVPAQWRERRLADAGPMELAAWAPLVVLVLALGLYPRLVLGLTEPAVGPLLRALA